MGWSTGPLLGFDTETTGTDVARDRIVSAALVRRDPGGTRVRTWLLDPGVPVPGAAAAIHGLSTEHTARYGRPPALALEEVARVLVAAVREGVPVVAYNAAFDLDLLDVELRRHGRPTLPERLGAPVRPVLDPWALDRCVDPDRAGGRRLADLCAVYRVPTGALHRADVDAVATLDLLAAVVERFGHLDAVGPGTLHDRQVVARRERAAARAARAAAASPAGRDDDPASTSRAHLAGARP